MILAAPQVDCRWQRRPVILRYGFAPAAIVAAFGLRVAMTAWAGPGLPPYVTFYPAVMLVALLTGFGPGALATLLTDLVVSYWILPPVGHFAIASPVERIGLVIFTGTSLVVCLIIELYRRNRDKAAAYDREAVAHEGRERLAAIVDSSDDAILAKDLDGIIQSWNAGAERMFGYAAPEVIGRPITILIPPERQEEEARILAQVLRGESLAQFETVRLRKDGRRLDVSVTISPMKDAQGRNTGVSKIIRDITERNREEGALRESEARFRALVEEASDAYFLHDVNGRFIDVNLRACESLGYSREELLRMNVTDVEQDFDLAGAQAAWRRMKPGAGVTLYGRQRRKDGTEFPVEVRLGACEIGGQPLYLGLVRDVTERERADAALRASEERFRMMVNAMPQLAWIAQPDGYISWYNQRWYDYTGTTSEQMAGWGWQSVHDEVELPRVIDRWKASIATGDPFEMTFPLRGADGVFRPFLTRVIPLKDAAGCVVQWFGTNTDVNELKRVEDALRESRDRLGLALGAAGMASFDWDIVNNKRYWDDNVHRLLGTNPETFTGKPEEFFRVIHPEDLSAVQEALARALETDAYWSEYRVVLPDGNTRHMTARGKVHRDSAGRAVHMPSVCWDITETKNKEKALHQLNRTLKALRASSQAMTRATEEREYLEEVCRIVVQDCGHAMVWIGFAEENEDKSVRPVAYAGFEEGYIETLKVTWEADTGSGRGPTGTAIRTGKPRACRNMLTDPAFGPWREQALKRGYASSLALPLMTNGRAFGALTFYSSEPDSFPEDEVELLAELADDLAFGIATIRLRLDLAGSQQERETTFEFLRLINASTGTRNLVQAATHFFQHQSGCEAIGVRLKDGEDYPYFETRGFPEEFVLAENSLCARDRAGNLMRDSKGNPIHECMCGNVIRGEFDPVKPFFTPEGVFWTNSTTELLATTTEKDRQARTRNRCNGEGYESVALIPLSVGGKCLGLLQMNDRRKGLFSLETIASWERRAGYLAVALAKFHAEDELRRLNVELDERIRLRTLELQTSNQELEAFCYSVSHDLRAPLRGIDGFSQVLRDDYASKLDAAGKDFLDRIRTACQRMAQLIDDLLKLSRLSRAQMQRRQVNLSNLAQELADELRGAAPERTVEFRIAEGVKAVGDAALMRVALSNLLGNAWKFTGIKAEAVIEFGVRQGEDSAIYFVRDNGAGFDMAYGDKLFTPFQRLHGITEFPGTGIGLATVARVIRRHGGRVWAEAAVDQGATFYFTLEFERELHG